MQTNFKRYELKYILTKEQHRLLIKSMPGDIVLDGYGRHKISNIYFDTEDFKIIRHSLEKPKYKEKLRVRCYGKPSDDANAFIELKKKFDGVVYKRRIFADQKNILSYLCENTNTVESSQILIEIEFFKSCFYVIKPKVFLCY